MPESFDLKTTINDIVEALEANNMAGREAALHFQLEIVASRFGAEALAEIKEALTTNPPRNLRPPEIEVVRGFTI